MIGSMHMAGIIFANIRDESLGALTEKRATASVPFGGRYRHIDFILSNMVNSGVDFVGIVTRANYQSLMRHIGNPQEWELNRKDGGLVFLPPAVYGSSDLPKGKLSSLRNALDFLSLLKDEYVLLSDSYVLCNIDFSAALASHIASGCDVTAVVSRQIPRDSLPEIAVCHTHGRVTAFRTDVIPGAEDTVGMNMYILSRKYLLSLIEKNAGTQQRNLERGVFEPGVTGGSITMNAYEYEGMVLRNRDTLSYFENNLRLKDSSVRHSLFDPAAPIYTKSRDEVPALYAEGSLVSECTVADGCSVYGTAMDCVLSRGVVIEKNATAEHCVILSDCIVEEGASLCYCILDKCVRVSRDTVLCGTPDKPVIITKGITV